MCGRFFADATPREMAAFFEQLGADGLATVDYAPRFNIAPTQQALGLVVHQGAPGPIAITPQFGVAKRRGAGLIINARAETAPRLSMFREAAAKRRCAFVANGFYEWQPKPAGPKVPHAIRARHHAIIGLAGLLLDEEHMVIVTTEASLQMQPLHARMPLMLADAALHTWLSPTTSTDDAFALAAPERQPALEAVAISRRVNSPRHDDASCLEPAEA